MAPIIKKAVLFSLMLMMSLKGFSYDHIFTVKSTLDQDAFDLVLNNPNPISDADRTLRWAMTQANVQTSGTTLIDFNIPGSGPYQIVLSGSLPDLWTPTIIDGRTQPGTTNSSLIKINCNSFAGIAIFNNSAIYNLEIFSAIYFGIVGHDNNSMINCIIYNIKYNPGGTVGNTLDIRGNGNIVRGCILGTDPNGVLPPSEGYGIIMLSANNNIIGGNAPGQGNVITNTGQIGILINSGIRNKISRNVIHNNYVNQITLAPNANINYAKPIIASYSQGPLGGIISGTSLPNSTIELFLSAEIIPSSFIYPGSYQFLGENEIPTDALGHWSISGLNLSGGQYVIATATDPNGNTSEFSSQFVIPSTISTSPITSVYCKGDDINLNFLSSILTFNSDNIFTAELSDANGSFGSPSIIGTLESATVAPILITLPDVNTYSSNYKIRVKSSSPAITGSVINVSLGFNLSLNVPPDFTLCRGGFQSLIANGASSYAWFPQEGLNAVNTASVLASPNVTTTYTVVGTSVAGCQETKTVTVTVKPTLNVQPQFEICTGTSATITASGANTYSWTPSAGLNTTTGATVIANPAGTTEYTVTGTTTEGCIEQKKVLVNIASSQSVDFASNVDVKDATGKTIIFTNSSSTYSFGASYHWNYGDGNSVNAGINAKHQYGAYGNFLVTLTVTNSNGCVYTVSKEVVVGPIISEPPFECCTIDFPVSNIGTGIPAKKIEDIGYFNISPNTGEIFYKEKDCPAKYEYSCFSKAGIVNANGNVISANAITFSDEWSTEINTYEDPYETGEKGKWRPSMQYANREVLNRESGVAYYNFNSGSYKFNLFDWKNPEVNDINKWVLTSNTLKYSQNGQPVSDKNILDIHSTAQYGYKGNLPILVAQNAEDNTVAFEGFENTYINQYGSKYFENGLPSNDGEYGELVTVGTQQAKAHTGVKAIKLKKDNTFLVANVKVTEKTIAQGGYILRIWISSSENLDNTNVKIYYGENYAGPLAMNKVLSAGEWSLFEVKISSSVLFVYENAGHLPLGVQITGINSEIYIDDVRVQPLESEMVCYVYDNAQRLVAVLDDQHFAMLYQYNAEGILVRKLKETIEGIKTISETQYNTQGIPR